MCIRDSLKTVEIGYTFPKKWMEKIYSKGARVFVSGNNLLCFSPFKLWDPELGTNNGLKYPMNRSISVSYTHLTLPTKRIV